MLGAGVKAADRGFFAERIAEAIALRESILPPETTGYRLLNAEGDGVPGWTVDRFGDVLVSQITAAGLEAFRGEAYAALAAALPGAAIVQSNDLPARRSEGLPTEPDEVIAGEPPAAARFAESGLLFMAELIGGQKTGFYCDQRENRRRAERFAAGRTVLDLFAHTGAFALYAVRGGARKVICVESAARLIERGRDHVTLNGLPAERLEWVKANVFEDLRRREEKYGLVVCDPPPLVRKRPDLDAAARAYKDLNRLALARVEPGGFLLTFSCRRRRGSRPCRSPGAPRRRPGSPGGDHSPAGRISEGLAGAGAGSGDLKRFGDMPGDSGTEMRRTGTDLASTGTSRERRGQRPVKGDGSSVDGDISWRFRDREADQWDRISGDGDQSAFPSGQGHAACLCPDGAIQRKA
jgi:23S rRNA G2069 N7-methylase RlmK/C1962 C5-methylase RlmI